ncbi:MAG: FtsW/RodA/SpoVE family cell cycle protein, partial [Chloroflexota bacterium]
LVAVNFFGDDTFGARRALIGGSLQPGELAEFTMVLYMAAWLGAKRTRPDSFLFGLIPFGILLGLIITPIALQPDISTVVIIGLTTGAMFFLAGARILHLIIVAIVAILLGWVLVQNLSYAQDRVDTYLASLADPTEANYHTQQVITAFVTGGWTGKGLGQGTQKFNNALPAPHTDSIFAVIGEELGVVGASFVVFLFIAFVIRGLQVARRAIDPFGALLVSGLTLWVAVQALLNIAVMTAIIPTSGLPLPFISYGGSALLVTLIGVGLILNVSRVATMRENESNRRQNGASNDSGWGNRRARLSRTSSRRGATQVRRRA